MFKQTQQTMTPRTKQIVLAAGSIVIIAVSLRSVWSHMAEPGENLTLHQRVGQVLAEQTIQLLGNTGRVAVITLKGSQFPILKAQGEAFNKTLRKSGVHLVNTIAVNPKGKAKYGPGRGLSAVKFLQIRSQNDKLDALVSLIGLPDLDDQAVQQLKSPGPKVIAETKAGERLERLLDQEAVQVAVVPRFIFPAPVSKHPHGPHAQFDRYFQIVKESRQSTAVTTHAPVVQTLEQASVSAK